VQNGKFKGETTKVPLWEQFHLARLAAGAGLEDRARQLADALPDQSLRGRVYLEILRAQLGAKKGQGEPAWDKSAPENTVAQAIAVFLVARHKAQYGSSSATLSEVDTLEPEKLRPFGYLGVALGMQDGKR